MLVTVLLLVAAESSAVAPIQRFPVAVDSPAAAPQAVRAVRLTRPVGVDGVLRAPIWETAERVSALVQRDPLEGAQPTESTGVYRAYDDAALYIRARLDGAHPAPTIAP